MTKKSTKKNDEITSYIVMRELDKEFPIPILKFSLEEAEKTFNRKNYKKRNDAERTDTSSSGESFSSLIDRALEAFLPYYQLATFSRILGPVMSRTMILEATLKKKNDFKIIKETKTKAIYGLTDSQVDQVSDTVEHGRKLSNSFDVVSNSVLLSVVATYDAHIGSISRYALLSNPDRIIKGDQSYKARDIFKASSFDDLLESIVDDEVHLILWESHQKQIEKIEELFGITIVKNFTHWGKFIEVFERRNLVAHGNATASARYVSLCEKADCDKEDRLEINAKIDLDPAYLRKSVDILLLFLIVLTWNIWIKLKKDQFVEAFEKINAVSFDLIKEGRHRLATRLLNIMIGWKHASVPERARRMMVINLANAHKFLEETDESLNALATYQWDSVADDFKICEAAVRGNTKEVCSLLPKFADESLISKASFRNWPVFNWVREEEDFKKAFESVFGEELLRS